jgi:hypothetical protein
MNGSAYSLCHELGGAEKPVVATLTSTGPGLKHTPLVQVCPVVHAVAQLPQYALFV